VYKQFQREKRREGEVSADFAPEVIADLRQEGAEAWPKIEKHAQGVT